MNLLKYLMLYLKVINMNKYVYHGSSVGGLKTLIPKKSTHLKPYVYATTNRTIALIFMAQSNGDLDTVISGCGTVDKPSVLVERWDGAFQKNYRNPGYLYTLNSKNFKKEDGLWDPEVVSENEEGIIKEEYISSIYDELIKHSKKGEIILYNYPNRPAYIPLDNSDLIEKYSIYENSGIKGALKNVLNVYPEFENEIYKILNLKVPKFIYIVSGDENINKTKMTLLNGRGKIDYDGYIAYESEIRAIESAKAFIRDDGWISYNIVNNRFIFSKGSLDLSKKLHLFKVNRKGFQRFNSYEFCSINKPHILSKELIDLSKYI